MPKENLKCGPVEIPVVTQRTIALLGGKGSGKTQTAKSLMYQLSKDFPNLDLVVLDPIGKIAIKDFTNIHVTQADIESGGQVGQVLSRTRGNRIIISLDRMLREEHKVFVDSLFAVWQPHDAVIFVDESHDFLPQGKNKNEYCMELERLIRHGRNDNVGFIMASQRPASVDKDVLALTDFLILYRLTWSTDVEAVKRLISTGTSADEILSRLQSMENFHGWTIDFNPGIA